MRSAKRVIAALCTACLLAAGPLNVEAAGTGALKNTGAKGFANASPVAAGLLTAGTSKSDADKKAGTSSSGNSNSANSNPSEKEKKTTEKKAAEETKKQTAEKAKKAETSSKDNAEKAETKKTETKQTAQSPIEKAKNAALNALTARLAKSRECVYVYKDYGLTKNHFTQKTKIYGKDDDLVKNMNEDCGKEPYSGTSCIRCEQTGSKKDWGGWMFLNGYLKKWDGTPKPNDGRKGGAGLDLTGADALRFYARGKKGGEVVEFFTCGFGYDKNNKKTTDNPDSSTRKSTGQVKLTRDWKEYVIPLDKADLSYIVCGFGYEVDGKANNKKDTVFYLDEIRFTGKISSARTAPVLLRSSDANDEMLVNAAFTEDNALAVLAFLSEGKRNEAKQILNAFMYAVQNDRAYDSSDSKNDSKNSSKNKPVRARNAYAAGDISALPGWNSGTRLSGWYDKDSGKWVEEAHQVGSSTGSNAYAALAFLQYYNTYGCKAYLETACSLMDWIIENCYDRALGFKEGFDGWEESDELDVYTLDNRPTKDNVIAYAAFSRLYETTGKEKYLEGAQTAIRFLEGMYKERKGRFIRGTLAEAPVEETYVSWDGSWDSWTESQNESDEEGSMLDDSIVTLDDQSLTALAMWDSFGPYLDTLHTIERIRVKKGGYPFNRNNKSGGWWAEGTAFTALTFRVFGKENLYKEAMDNLVKIQKSNGLFPAATVNDYYTGLKLNDGSSLKLTKDTHIAPAAWFIMAANGYNPFAPHPVSEVSQ